MLQTRELICWLQAKYNLELQFWQSEWNGDPDAHTIMEQYAAIMTWGQRGFTPPVPYDDIRELNEHLRPGALEDWHRGDETDILGLQAVLDRRYPLEVGDHVYWTPPDFPPADTVKEHLQQRVRQLGQSTIEGYVLARGQYHEMAPENPYLGRCFGICSENSRRIYEEFGLRYAAGFARPSGRRWPYWPELHAWNLDEAGRVIDVTWGEMTAEYFGLVVVPGVEFVDLIA